MASCGRRGNFKMYSVVTKDGLKINKICMSRKVYKEAIKRGDKLKEI